MTASSSFWPRKNRPVIADVDRDFSHVMAIASLFEAAYITNRFEPQPPPCIIASGSCCPNKAVNKLRGPGLPSSIRCQDRRARCL